MKLLKLLASKMDKEEQKCLPLLLNVIYYRETLFIVYELLRDNLYHMCPRRPVHPSLSSSLALALALRVHHRLNVCRAHYRADTSISRSAGCQNTSRCEPHKACMQLG